MSGPRPRGFVLLPVLLAATVVALVALLLTQAGAMLNRQARNAMTSAQVEYVTEAGLNHVLWQVRRQGCGPFSALKDVAFGAGRYSATITPNKAGGATTIYRVSVSDDARIKSDTPTQNYGSDGSVKVFKGFSSEQRALFKFDIQNSGIPADVQIIYAAAKIFVLDSNASTDVTVHRVTADWSESTVDWDAVQASHEGSAIATIPRGTPAGHYVSLNIAPLVQGWLNGSIPNQGIMLKSGWGLDSSKFSSKEDSDPAQHPYLEVKVLDGTLSNRADIRVTGTLANGISRTRVRPGVALYQTPANVVSQQPGGAEGRDTFILRSKTDRNYGAHGELWVTRWGGDEGRALLRFRTDSIPPGAHVVNARLQLYQDTPSSDGGPVSVHRVTSDWAEGGKTGQTGPGATWSARDTGVDWHTPGGGFDPQAVATTDIPMGVKGWFAWDVTSLVQGWVDGAYANQGLMLFPETAATDVYFSSSDASGASLHPKLTIEYTCECGVTCQLPQGSGNLLLVVGDAATPDPADVEKKALFESWGYAVTFFDDGNDRSAFDTALANSDLAYVSETAVSWTLGNKLTSTEKGVVNEEGRENAKLGISSSHGATVGRQLEVTDNSHYITSLFPVGVIPIYTADMEGLQAAGTLAADLQTLGEFAGSPGLAVIEKGGVLADGSSVAAGRRVMLPIGRHGKFNWKYLNNNGYLIVQRAIEWAATAPAAPPPPMKVYWTDDQAGKIQRADPDGGNLEDVLTGLDAPTGLAIDTANGKIYWANGHSEIRRANLDGAGAETVVTEPASSIVFDVKVDTANGKVYWTNNSTRSIRRANLDGSLVETVYAAASGRPAYISLDTRAGQVYYTDFDGGTVSRVNMDGTGQVDLVTGLGNPVGNGLDVTHGKIYWSDGSGGDSVRRAGLDGSGVEVVASGIGAPQDVAVDPQNARFYWAGAWDQNVRGADLDGANAADVAGGLTRPRGVVLVEASRVPPTGGGGGGGGGGSGGCNGTFRDEFNTVSYSNNDGTLVWAGDWKEINESDGAGAGDERVRNDNGSSRLRVQDNDGGGEGVEREADLSGAAAATLSFRYRRSGLDNANDYVKVEISANGAAGPWTEIARFQGKATDYAYRAFSQDISGYISSKTRIRLLTSPKMGGRDAVMFDDVQIQCSPY